MLQNIDAQETQVDMINSTVGIPKLMLTVNGHVLQFPNLINGQTFSFSIAPYLKAGHSNTIAVVGIGPKDSTALVFIAPRTPGRGCSHSRASGRGLSMDFQERSAP